jgi:hypothetical protein
MKNTTTSTKPRRRIEPTTQSRAPHHPLPFPRRRAPYAPPAEDDDPLDRTLPDAPELRGDATIRESAPEYNTWDPLHGSTGYQEAEAFADYDDHDGRSDTELLVEQGSARAERDRRLTASEE